jgi:hypothetical protein
MKDNSDNPGDACIFVENRKEVIEISQSFLKKSAFYRSYVVRAVMELVTGLILLSWLSLYGLQETLEVSFK